MGTILGSRHRHQLGGGSVQSDGTAIQMVQKVQKMWKNSATYTFQSKKNLKVCMS